MGTVESWGDRWREGTLDATCPVRWEEQAAPTSRAAVLHCVGPPFRDEHDGRPADRGRSYFRCRRHLSGAGAGPFLPPPPPPPPASHRYVLFRHASSPQSPRHRGSSTAPDRVLGLDLPRAASHRPSRHRTKKRRPKIDAGPSSPSPHACWSAGCARRWRRWRVHGRRSAGEGHARGDVEAGGGAGAPSGKYVLDERGYVRRPMLPPFAPYAYALHVSSPSLHGGKLLYFRWNYDDVLLRCCKCQN